MINEVRATAASAAPPRPRATWLLSGVLRTAIIVALSLASWWLFVDPVTNIAGWNVYPQPFTGWLFWCLITMVCLGFNLEFHHFAALSQPLRGITLVAVSSGIATLVTALLSTWLGDLAPSISGDRSGGAGYATASMWVLYAFLFYVMSVVNWNHWPWTDDRIRQPWKGFAEILALFFPTTVLYLAFALPNLVINPGKTIMSLDTSVGFFYCVILSVVLTGNLTDNWPWRLAGSPAKVAAASLIGNLALGAILYAGLRAVVPLLIGQANTVAIGSAAASLPAQFGVCWVLWAILWPNAFGNYPAGESVSQAKRYAIRIVVTLVLAVLTFWTYYFLIAGPLLHESPTGANMSGNALGFIDHVVLWALWYLLCFESWGLPKRLRDPSTSPTV